MSTVDITKNFDDTANDTQNDADSSKEPSAKRQRAANREYITFKSFSSFTEAYDEPVPRVICWIHVLRNCNVHLRNTIVADIMQI